MSENQEVPGRQVLTLDFSPHFFTLEGRWIGEVMTEITEAWISVRNVRIQHIKITLNPWRGSEPEKGDPIPVRLFIRNISAVYASGNVLKIPDLEIEWRLSRFFQDSDKDSVPLSQIQKRFHELMRNTVRKAVIECRGKNSDLDRWIEEAKAFDPELEKM